MGDTGRGRVDDGAGIRGDRHGGGLGFQRHVDIHVDRGADADDDFGDGDHGEAVGVGGEGVLTGRHVVEGIEPVRAGGLIAAEAGGGIREVHFRGGDDGVRNVVNRSADRAILQALRVGAGRAEQ